MKHDHDEFIIKEERLDVPLECGPGWEELIKKTIESLKLETKNAGMALYISQIKEKGGELRIYLAHSTDKMENIIAKATEQSRITCENCGLRGQMRNKGYWISTRCDKCWEKWANEVD